MTEDQRKQVVANFKRATEKWSGLVYEPFQSEEARDRHEQQVRDDVASGICEF